MEVYNLKSKKTLILFFALAMVASACSSAAVPCDEVEITTGENGLPDLDGCEFTFAVENAYLPFNYIDPADGEGKGWDYDVFNYLAEEMNFTPVFVAAAWDGMIQAVADGQYMIAGDGISITDERDKIVDFSDSYIVLQQRMLVAADNDSISSAADIQNGDFKVATQKGTTNYDLAVSLFGADKVDAYDQFDFAIAAVISGDAAASIVDEVAGLGYMGANKDKVKLVGEGLQTDPLGFAFPDGSPLVAVVNEGLAHMKDNGKLQEINDKFFSPGFTVSYDDIAEVTYDE
ncbi:ABC transporter substrate-binding protein [Acidimicrobiaceae bacterium]|nr:ABC transporter substrate-binding protein [Acidimicrobiaceae bacterium]